MADGLARAPSTKPARWRPRLGLRRLMILILLLGLAFGWLAHMQRQVREQKRFIAELARDRIRVNHAEPTVLCLFLMKVLGTDSRETERRCARWLGPGWFSRPRGFNAGRLEEERVASVVERLSRLGTVWEITFTSPSLAGLKLFAIDRVLYNNLGTDGKTCIIKRHPAATAREGLSSADGQGTRR